MAPLIAAALALTAFGAGAPAGRERDSHERPRPQERVTRFASHVPEPGFGRHEPAVRSAYSQRADIRNARAEGREEHEGFHERAPIYIPYAYDWDDPLWWGPGWYGSYPPLRRPVQVIPVGMVPVRLGVHPARATVAVDGRTVGEVRDFDDWHPLLLKKGDHVVRFSEPGYQTLRIDVDAINVGNTMLDYRLVRGSGIDPRSDAAPANA